MKKSFIFILVMMVMYSGIGLAQKPADKGEPVLNYDTDGDKIFESLQRQMKVGLNSDLYNVIVLFHEDVQIPGLMKQLGEFQIKTEYNYLYGFAGELKKGQILALSKMPFVQQIQLDAEVHITMDTAKEFSGVNKAVGDFGVDGDRDGNTTSYSANDVVVAVIDTGIDSTHVDLDGGKVLGFQDFVNNQTIPYDDHGHGSHCAGIIAGTGEGNNTYQGVAAGAALIGLKVLDQNGSGNTSDIDAAIQWCIDHKDTYGIDIINMSLGSSGSSDGTDSTSLLIHAATDAGIVCVVAAGNDGPSEYTVGSPGAAPDAITVGANADMGEEGFFQAYFSSRGPTADERIKPDITAPGWQINSVLANSTNGYTEMSGTSMAAPFCTGTIALMLDANPNQSPLQVKTTLMNTADDWGLLGKDVDYGAGLLQAYKAVKNVQGWTGTDPILPPHWHEPGTILAQGNTEIWELEVSTLEPVAVTLIMPGYYETGWWLWKTGHPDFDIYVYDPDGDLVASAENMRRQEDVSFIPMLVGTYEIHIYAYTDYGDYFIDVSAGASGLNLTQDQ